MSEQLLITEISEKLLFTERSERYLITSRKKKLFKRQKSFILIKNIWN